VISVHKIPIPHTEYADMEDTATYFEKFYAFKQ